MQILRAITRPALVIAFCAATCWAQVGSTGTATNRSTAAAFAPGVTQSRFGTNGCKDPFFPKENVEPPKVTPEQLRLDGVSLGVQRRLAVINDHTFAIGEQAEVKLGAAKVTIRCLEIAEDSAVIEFTSTGQRQTLKLKPRLQGGGK